MDEDDSIELDVDDEDDVMEKVNESSDQSRSLATSSYAESIGEKDPKRIQKEL